MPSVNERRLKSENDELKRALAALRVTHAEDAQALARLTKTHAVVSVAAQTHASLDDFTNVLNAGLVRIEAAMKQAIDAAHSVAARDDQIAEALATAIAAKAERDELKQVAIDAKEAQLKDAGELDTQRRRCTFEGKQAQETFDCLTKHLPAGFEHMTVRQIGEQPGGAQKLHAALVDLLSWAAAERVRLLARKSFPVTAPKKKPSGVQYRKAKKASEG